MAITTELEPRRTGHDPMQLPPLLNEVTNIDYGIGDDCKITFKCNNRLFVVLLSIKAPVGSTEQNYLERLNHSLIAGEEEEEESIFQELIDLLAGLCQPLFREFAANTLEYPCPIPTLYNILYREMLQLRLKTIEGGPILYRKAGPQMSPPNSFRYEDSNLPIYKPSEVEILDTLKSDTVFKARIQGLTVCVKVLGNNQVSTQSIRREMRLLQLISHAKLHPPPRSPTMIGLVSAEDNSNLILGLVMNYIEPGALTSNLFSLELASIPRTIRDIWVSQISDDLNKLHGIGLVWGDAKAGNIIFDKECNPWIIDFGGGYTDNWVDAELADSITGDLQGLRRIIDFIQVSGQ